MRTIDQHGSGKTLILPIALLIMITLFSGEITLAASQSSTTATVVVLPQGSFSYGKFVADSEDTFMPFWSLGEPDGRGAWIFHNGWISIGLSGVINSTSVISIRADSQGWHNSHIKVYVSADGKKWKPAGNVNDMTDRGDSFRRYDFNGNFGNIKYIRVNRGGGQWSFLRLDAVYAKGGDSGKQPKDDKQNHRED